MRGPRPGPARAVVHEQPQIHADLMGGQVGPVGHVMGCGRLVAWGPADGGSAQDESGVPARGLEDESRQRRLTQQDDAPPAWRRPEAFSAVACLTPEETSRVADVVRWALAPCQDHEQRPMPRPGSARPVALITRLFPLLSPTPDETGRRGPGRIRSTCASVPDGLGT
nr:hypothetical protein StreXyl84_32670 [Streptomyces sp. Xyl84]